MPLEISLVAFFCFIRVLFRNTDKSLDLCINKLIKDMERVKIQRHLSVLSAAMLIMTSTACEDPDKQNPVAVGTDVRLEQVARILSAVQLDQGHLEEVHAAVVSSSGNGYDEEYTMKDLFESPGRGVGDDRAGTKSSVNVYDNPLRELIREHVHNSVQTRSARSGIDDPDEFLNALCTSDIQIYWPFSDSWDGVTMPVITFDPEDGADVNVGYRLVIGNDGTRHVEEVIVDEEVAMEEPVWVVNRNSDAGHTSLELLRREDPDWGVGGGTIIVKPETKSESASKVARSLVLKDFTMNRSQDSWFAGASEFFVKAGFVDDFTAATEAELKMYNPKVTDFMIVVKRNQVGVPQHSNTLLVSEWNDQMSHCAFMITEDDGGTRTEWKCTALVRIKSKSYGVEINLPFNTRDDIIWRGQLSENWLENNVNQVCHFGDVDVTFELVEM